MLGKCSNPACSTPFRKLGVGKLFAFESAVASKSIAPVAGRGNRSRSPAFFWLCECCCLSFTLRLDSTGELTLQRIAEGVQVTIFDRHPLGYLE